MKPRYWDDGKRALARRDPVLRRIIRAHPDVHLQRRSDAFTALARAIVGQQISVKAADSIWRRLAAEAAAAGVRTRTAAFPRLDAARLAALDDARMRAIGMSRSKARYLQDLALHFLTGKLAPRRWHGLDDESLITLLIDVKGIGRWTAEMFLIFHAMRPDVFPLADIGLRRALALHYNGGEPLEDDRMRDLGMAWQPYRSVATWYLWRSLDPVPVEY